MAQRRVILGFDPSPVGANALWWAVAHAQRLRAVLFVVVRRPRPPILFPMTWSVRTGQVSGTVSGKVHVAVGDALLLAVGEAPSSLDIRIAPGYGSLCGSVRRFADRRDDVVLLASAPHRWRGLPEPLVATDPLGPPVPASVVHSGRKAGQVFRFPLR
ncbi:MAG TPA: hypothetical protein VGN81_23115 [Pseudonocardiaceae bacterium]